MSPTPHPSSSISTGCLRHWSSYISGNSRAQQATHGRSPLFSVLFPLDSLRAIQEPKGCPNPDKDREDPCRSWILQGAVLPGKVIQVVPPLQGGVHTPIQPCPGGMTQKTPLSRTKLTHSISPS
ncbi:Hypothetical predicted protein [Marmota monax]|uniref:Uncharacterized protein n=1 Tax=Marmota monax TaxID=9995 RepID=A0A5E4BG54_MARMO|nr:Hypothetical predicted protein [Marmota monax]